MYKVLNINTILISSHKEFLRINNIYFSYVKNNNLIIIVKRPFKVFLFDLKEAIILNYD